MASGRLIIPAFDPALYNGEPVAGATLTVYANRTTTLASLWQDRSLSVAAKNAAPGNVAAGQVSNAQGRWQEQSAFLWLDAAALYTVVVQYPATAGGGTFTMDDVAVLASDADGSSVASVAALRAISGLANGEAVNLLGYYAAGDGGGGDLFVDGTDTTSTDNGVTVFVTADGKRVKRVFPPAAVDDFRIPADGDDWGPTIARALAANNHVYFKPSTSTRRITSQQTILLTRDTVIDWCGQQVQFDGGRLTLQSELRFSGRALAADAARYAKQITLNNASEAAAGDLIYINTAIQPSLDWADTKQDLVKIAGKSGNALTLAEGLNFAYETTDTSLDVLCYRPVKLTMRDFNGELIAPDASTSTFIMVHCVGLRDVTIDAPSVRGNLPFNRAANIYRSGFWLSRCWGGLINGMSAYAMSYPVGIYGASRNITEIGTTANYCHHSHADVGGYGSDYRLIGLHSSDSYQAINTHVSFRCHASDFVVKNDFGLSNWRSIGGSLRNGYIQSSVDDTAELPQFNNTSPASDFAYMQADADFDIDNVVFDTPNRVTNAPVAVKYGRNVRYSGMVAPSAGVGFSPGDVALYINGPGNRIGTANASGPAWSAIRATQVRADSAPPDVPLIASAGTIALPLGYATIFLTGTTNITNITATGHEGRQVTLIFTDALTVQDGGNLALAGSFTTTNGDTLTLACAQGAWFEVARSPN